MKKLEKNTIIDFENIINKNFLIIKKEYLRKNFKNGLYFLIKNYINLILRAQIRILVITCVLEKLHSEFPKDKEVQNFTEKFEKISYCYDISADTIIEIQNLMI